MTVSPLRTLIILFRCFLASTVLLRSQLLILLEFPCCQLFFSCFFHNFVFEHFTIMWLGVDIFVFVLLEFFELPGCVDFFFKSHLVSFSYFSLNIFSDTLFSSDNHIISIDILNDVPHFSEVLLIFLCTSLSLVLVFC